MDTRTVLRRVWNDSVWSKVIAAAITAVLAGGLSTLVSSWHALEAARRDLLRLVEAPVTVPTWSLAALGLVIAVLAGLSGRVWSRRWARDRVQRNASDTDDIQPNAVPILEAHLFACPLELPPDYASTLGATSRVP